MTKEILLFLAGVITSFATLYLAFIIWRKKIESALKNILDPGVETIERIKSEMDGMKGISLEVNKEIGSLTQQIAPLTSILRGLSAETGRAQEIHAGAVQSLKELSSAEKKLGSLLRQIESFVVTANKIQEVGVKVTKDLPPDLDTRIIFLFPQEELSLVEKIRKSIRDMLPRAGVEPKISKNKKTSSTYGKRASQDEIQ